VADAEWRASTQGNVDKAPTGPGVYELAQAGEVIYVGSSESSLRSRLQSHQSGTEGACTKAATQYRRQVTASDRARGRERELLTAYKAAHGRLPKCNASIP